MKRTSWVIQVETELDDDTTYQTLVRALKGAGFGIVTIDKE
jgi:uncharacterized protein (DUF302 family)